MAMAQLVMRSLWIRPLCHQLPGHMWKSKGPCRAFSIGCGRITHSSHGEVFQSLSSTPKSCQKVTAGFFCTSSNTETHDSTKFTLIYKFPAIRFCRTVSRMKLIQTSLTVLILPPVYYSYLQGQVTEFAVVYCTGAALFAGIMLYGLSYYLRRMIGMLYVNDDLTTVKVSYLTFWGNRKDSFVPIDDIKQLSETGDGKREILRQFARYSNADVLYFTTRYGFVLDREKFTMVFGDLE
ncbi:transmembrane protein 186 [Dendropsophus ebraccatus]|uniref:transmembrane protein 186 n=1 Tax=Dendropsophus ebraccatus TaxID=150705 RepID=UPI0038321230